MDFPVVSVFTFIKTLRPMSSTAPEIIFAVSSQCLSISQLLPSLLVFSLLHTLKGNQKNHRHLTPALLISKFEPNPIVFSMMIFTSPSYCLLLSCKMPQVHLFMVSGDRNIKDLHGQHISKQKHLQGMERQRATGLCRLMCW